jgi:O-antigen/teichoic acid export membrane protein
MVRNSMFSLLSTALQAILGFAFWVLAARLFTAPEVGRATSLISATTLIGFIALFGLNSTIVRFLPTSQHKNVIITVALALVGSVGMLVAIGYVFALPLIAPQLRFLGQNAFFAIGFVLLAGASAVNLLTDSIFIASRRTGINAFVDGGVGGAAKLVLIGLLASSGTYGLFCASVGGFAAAALASLVLIWTQLHFRPKFKGAMAALRPMLRFSGANYMGNVFNLVPTLVVTLIVLDRLGAYDAGYYYVAFQFANLLYSCAYAVEQNFLAEGAHGEEELLALMRRAGKVLVSLAVPAAIGGALFAHWILLIFGNEYARHGSDALVLMALATIPIAAQNWFVTVLRLSGQLVAITICNASYAVAICALAWFLAPRGLTMIGAAWLIGPMAGVVTAGGALLWSARHGGLQGKVVIPGVTPTAAEAPPLVSSLDASLAIGPVLGTSLALGTVTEESNAVVTVDPPTTAALAREDGNRPAPRKGRRWWPSIAVVVVLLVGATLVTPAGRHQWDISILRQPTHDTTLSFENATTLPANVAAGKSVHLLFTVSNNEGRRVDYSYVVTSANADGSHAMVLKRSTVAVPAGRTQAVAIVAAPVCASASCRLAVRLPSQKETIDALVRVHRPQT